MINEIKRAGFIALIGATNVGKSTLINRLVGTKVSIVSPKVQTTRTQILGICIVDSAQIIFIDTPGIFNPRRRLDRAMVAAAWSGARHADHVILMIDASSDVNTETQEIIKNIRDNGQTPILAINKIDTVNKQYLLTIAGKLKKFNISEEIFMISATQGDGIDDLLNFCRDIVPEGPWLFPEDQISDMPERLMAAEITREKLYTELHQELPYASAVETESWNTKPDGSIRIDQIIYVERNTQKSIGLGKGGKQIKRIGEQARKELEKILGTTIHLFIFVKVRQTWGEDRDQYQSWALDFNAK